MGLVEPPDWLSHLGDQFSVGLAAPGIISGRHGRGTLIGLRPSLVNCSASTSVADRIS